MTEYAPPDGVAMLIAWITPLGTTTRSERPSGGELPFCMVVGGPGTDDSLTEKGMYSVHTFHTTKSGAYDEAMRIHRRIKSLAGRFAGQQKVTVGDREYVADDIKTIERPNEVQWSPGGNIRPDNSMSESPTQKIYRYVATYQMDLRFIEAT